MSRERAFPVGELQEVHARPDVLVARRAAREHAVLSAEELHECGLSDHAILTRVGNGRLHKRFRGVYAVGSDMLSLEGCFLAAVKACGPDAVLSHYSAAAVWGVVKWDGRDPEVTAPHPRRHEGIRAHRSNNIERVYRKGIPVTPPVRTLIDVSATLPYAGLRRAVNEALNLGLIKPADLVTSRHRGAGKLRLILATAAPTANEFEDIVLAVIHQAGLPRPEVNRRAVGYRPDFHWPAHQVILEADGARTHRHLLARADDAARQAVLEAAGKTVVRTTWREATLRPSQVIRKLANAGVISPSSLPA